MRRPTGRLPAVLALLLALADLAHADWQPRSWSRWSLGGQGAEVVFGMEASELRRLGDSGLHDELRRGMLIGEGAAACSAARIEPLAAAPGQVRFGLGFECGALPADALVQVRVFLERSPDPLHYATLERAGATSTHLFTRHEPKLRLAGPRPADSIPGTTARYARLGFGHILAGVDHIAFLLCMLLAANGLAARVLMITGFTIGHSITLSLAVLGMVRVAGAAVEALIGFTVALLAAEVFVRAQRTPHAALLLLIVLAGIALAALAGLAVALPLPGVMALLVLVPCYMALAARTARRDLLHLGMTAVFGLVHGIGFASALTAIGLPAQQKGWALAGFNLGVELGQLALLALFLVLALLAGRAGEWLRGSAGVRLLSGALYALGVYWLVQRSVG